LLIQRRHRFWIDCRGYGFKFRNC